jgi:outer membrane protein assembly factor BamB
MLRLALFAVLLGTVARVHAEDWTEFRGPTGQGRSTAENLPVEWSPSKNVVWRVDVPGHGWSSPIVHRGRVYMTTAVPQPDDPDVEQSLRALCLEAATGRRLWEVEVFQETADTSQSIHQKNSHASPTPLTDGRHLYVHFGTHGTACLTLDGEVVWKTQELEYDMRHGSGGSPVLADDTLVIACDGYDIAFVVGLDRRTGEIRWRRDRPEIDRYQSFSFGTPLAIEVAGRTQVVCPASDWVIAYDPADGSEIWKVQYDGYSVIPRPVYGHGLVFICTGYNTPSLLAIRPDGKGDVTRTHVAWRSSRAVPHTPSPLLVGDELYMVSDGGVASCVDVKTGRRHWQERLGGNFSASPLYADGKIYLQSEQGEGTVIEAGRQYSELARNRLEPRTFASYAVDGSAFLIRTERSLYRIEAGE